MNTSPNNVQLTPEQLQQLSVVQARLANLEAEVNIATESLTQMRQEMTQTVKDCKYQEELLDEIIRKNAEAKDILDTMNETLSQKTADIQAAKDTAAGIAAKHEAKEQDLSIRENALIEKEIEHARKSGLLSDAIAKYNADKEEVETKKQKIQSIISEL